MEADKLQQINDEHLAMLEAALGVLPVVKKGKVRG